MLLNGEAPFNRKAMAGFGYPVTAEESVGAVQADAHNYVAKPACVAENLAALGLVTPAAISPVESLEKISVRRL